MRPVNEEIPEVKSPCPFCKELVPDYQDDCPRCLNYIPFCIASGKYFIFNKDILLVKIFVFATTVNSLLTIPI